MSFVKSDEYRQRMEAFVTGLAGSTTWDTVTCMTTIPIAVFLLRGILAYLSTREIVRSPQHLPVAARFLMEYAVIVLLPLAVMTILADYSLQVHAAMLLLAVVLHRAATSRARSPPHDPASRWKWVQVAVDTNRGTPRLGFVSSFRSGMMLSTCIAILAVDFVVFPRRFAKTEMFGVSMMDLGVGSFVLASAMVSRQTRLKPAAVSSSSSSATATAESAGAAAARHTMHLFLVTLRGLAPLLILGFVKLGVNAAINYQVHVSEYGVHWNFFFTLAAVALASVAFDACGTAISLVFGRWTPGQPTRQGPPRSLLSAVAYVCGGLALGGLYQLLLLQRPPPAWLVSAAELDQVQLQLGRSVSLQDYILHAGRPVDSLFSQNREGVSGIAGFFSLYLCGIGVGRFVLNPSEHGPIAGSGGSSSGGMRYIPWACVAACGGLWALFSCAQAALGPVSRRLVNLPYIALVLAFCCTMLLCVFIAENVPCACCAQVNGEGLSTGSGSVGSVAGSSAAGSVASASRPRPQTRARARHSSAAAPEGETAAPAKDKTGAHSAVSLYGPVPYDVLASGSLILDAMSTNFLAIFVVANLGVGVVNSLLFTLDCPPLTAMVALACYIGAVAVFACGLRVAGINLKVW